MYDPLKPLLEKILTQTVKTEVQLLHVKNRLSKTETSYKNKPFLTPFLKKLARIKLTPFFTPLITQERQNNHS